MRDRSTWLVGRRCLRAMAVLCLGLLCTGVAYAEIAIEVTDAWVRATVPGQKVAGFYAEIRSSANARLVDVRSSAATSAELHSMSNTDGVMKMRRLNGLDLPAGERVRLEPGGIHIMLLDIKKPIDAGERVPVTLIVEQRGKRKEISLQAEVRSLREGNPHHQHRP